MADGPRRIVPFGRFDARDPLGKGINDKDFSFTPERIKPDAEQGKGTVTVEVPIPAADVDGNVTVPAPHPTEVSAVLTDRGLSGKDIPTSIAPTGEPDPPIGTGTDRISTGTPVVPAPDVEFPTESEIPEGTGTDTPPPTVPPLVAPKSPKSQAKTLIEDSDDS